jgi:hypothetical protein
MRKLLVLLSLAAFLFAGCGGDDDSSSTDASSDSSGGATTTAADTDFSGKGSGDFCDLARKYTKDFEDTTEAESSDDLEKTYKDLASAIDKLTSEAPKEIKADAEVVNDKFKEINTLLAKYDYDFSKVPEAEANKMSLDDPKVKAASDRVESYFEKVCKIDSDDDGDTDGVVNSDDAGTSEDEQAPDDTTDDGSSDDGSSTTETTEG